jgi:autotransporter-associated beta strand protein
VINATGTTYQVSDSINGAAINFTSAGTSVTQNVQSVLTLGSNGIVVNGSRSLPLLSSVVALSSNQTWSASSGRTIDSNNNTSNGGLLVLNNGNTLTVDGAGATQIASLVGTGGLIKNGNGTLALVNGIRFSYSGEVRLNSGTVLVGNSNPTGSTTLGTGNLYLGTDASDVAVSLGVGHNGATSTYDNNTILEGNATITLGAGTSFRLGTLSTAEKTLAVTGNSNQTMAFGATTLTGNAAFNVGNSTLTLGAVGQSGGSKSLVKNGNGILTINGTSTFTGQTIVNAGTLVVGTAGAINSSSSVTVANGATLTNSNTSTSMSAVLILSPGAALSGAGAFAPASMTLVANLAGGNASFSSINVGTTSLTKSGTMEFTLSNITDGNYAIFSGSALAGSFTSITVGGVALADLGAGNFGGTVGGFDYAFTNSTNTLGITTVPEPSTWALLGLGVALLIFRGVKRRHKLAPGGTAAREI